VDIVGNVLQRAALTPVRTIRRHFSGVAQLHRDRDQIMTKDVESQARSGVSDLMGKADCPLDLNRAREKTAPYRDGAAADRTCRFRSS
jgi:hypothetical protein